MIHPHALNASRNSHQFIVFRDIAIIIEEVVIDQNL